MRQQCEVVCDFDAQPQFRVPVLHPAHAHVAAVPDIHLHLGRDTRQTGQLDQHVHRLGCVCYYRGQ